MDNSAFGDDANRLRVSLPGEEIPPDTADPGAGSAAAPLIGRFGRRHLLYGGVALGVLLLAGAGIFALSPDHHVVPANKSRSAGNPMIAPAADLAKIAVATSPAPPARPAMVIPAKAEQLRQMLGFHEPSAAKPAVAALDVTSEASAMIAVPNPVVAEVGMTAPASAETMEQEVAPSENTPFAGRPSPNPGPAADAAAAALAREPMSGPQQIEVTQLEAMIHDERVEIAALQADQKKNAELVADKLGDVERRLALAEAKGAKSSTPRSPAPGPTGTGQQPARRYLVQAASPNLAILAPLDRSGDDGAPLQIGIGDDVPGYGKVTRIAQHGTAWVVETERGKIQ
jgi:hypothetical protein